MSKASKQLPTGWVETTIEYLMMPLADGRTLHQGWSPQCEKEPAPSDDEWGVLKTTAIQAGEFRPQHNKRLPKSLNARPQIEVKPGDLLITCAGPRVRCGVACLVRHSRPRLMMSGKMYRFRVSDQLFDARYLEAYLLTPRAKAAIDKMKTGSSDSGLNLTHDRFNTLLVPVAPVAEQQRIMDVAEELLSDLETGIRALEGVRAKLKQYRAAVLKAAVEGALTVDWRAAHPDAEPASELLKCILAERRRRWEEAQLKKYKDAGKEPPKNWKARYEEPYPAETAEMPALPQGWCWATTDQIADGARAITYGVIKLGAHQVDGVRVLRSSNVRHLRLDLADVKCISPSIANEFTRTFLKGGELLITVRGTLGGVVEAPLECKGYNVSREVAVIPPVLPALSGIKIFIAAPLLQNWLANNARGITYLGVNIEALKRLPIPLCPISELAVLAELVEDQLSVIDHLDADLESKVLSAMALRQSILRAAFEGKLVPQDPSDESASELLKRIAAERAEREKLAKAAKQAAKQLKPRKPRKITEKV